MMLRRLLPYASCFVLVLADVSLIPALTSGAYVFPLALCAVFCAGLSLGRLHGLLCGLISGLLVDITVGTPLGYMMVTYTVCGFLSGVFGFDSDEVRTEDGYSAARAQLRRIVIVFTLLVLFESVTMIYQYFNTALFMGEYLTRALLRAVIWTLAINALYWPVGRLYLGRQKKRVFVGAKKEATKL